MTAPSALVRKEIERFLTSPNPEVLCISGAWGVGKTFLWKDVLLTTAKALPSPPLLSYSYVSLFGMEKLEDVRLSIFANRISLAQSRVTKYFQWSLSHAKKAQGLLEQIPKVGGLFKSLGAMYFSSVRQMIVCIDDLERRSKGLEVKDVLGLISYLKDERRCKVAILLNDEELGVGAQDFRNYFEKTIDIHLRFAPTAEECSAIAFPNPDDLGQRIRNSCVALGIRNIRVIRKIEHAARSLQPSLEGFDPAIIDSAARSIVLLGWCVLKGTGAPSMEHLQKRNGLTTYSFDKESKPTAEEANWNSLLDNFSWGSIDELDSALISSLEAGYFDPEKIKAAAGEIWKRLEHQRLDGDFEDAWTAYRDSFDNNQDVVLDRLATSFKKTYKTITFMNLDATIRLFRELGRSYQAEELLKFYVENRIEPQKFWDLDDHSFGGDVKDPGVRAAIVGKFNSFGRSQVDMAGLLEAMGSTGKSWNMSDVDAIAVLPVSDYRKLFSEKRGRTLNRIVSGGLLARRIANPTAALNAVAERTIDALREIAGESAINARRVESIYGLSFNLGELRNSPKMSQADAENDLNVDGG